MASHLNDYFSTVVEKLADKIPDIVYDTEPIPYNPPIYELRPKDYSTADKF